MAITAHSNQAVAVDDTKLWHLSLRAECATRAILADRLERGATGDVDRALAVVIAGRDQIEPLL